MTNKNYISYKDTAARIVQKENGYFRYIFINYVEEYDSLMQSGLYNELVKNRLLITHEEVTVDIDEPKVYKLLYPFQIPFQSYPFEWVYSQWRTVILAYLKINQIALKYGMILKDATPYNFYLTEGKATMIDTSSFAFFKAGEQWIAYRQFCEEFLSPIALMHYNGQLWSSLLMTQLRGLPLNFVSKQLPIKSWLNLTTLIHIHLHSKYSNKTQEGNNLQKKYKGFSIDKIQSLLSMIESTIISWQSGDTYNNHWEKYYKNDIESDEYLKDKEQLVREWLKITNPESVIDLGANTGKFSFIAKEYSEKIIAVESDYICVDRIEKRIQNEKLKNFTVLVGDFTIPTPNLGLLNREFNSIYKRGKSDIVFALAIVHHLYFTYNLSFQHILENIALLCNNNAIVEFIEIEDEKVNLIRYSRINNKDLIQEYSKENFETQISNLFQIINEKRIMKTRYLYLLKKKKLAA
jgi:hypothetical protein